MQGQGKFLSVLQVSTYLCQKQEQWAACPPPPLPSPPSFPDSGGPDHLGHGEAFGGLPDAGDLQSRGLHFTSCVTCRVPCVFGALEHAGFRKTNYIYCLRGVGSELYQILSFWDHEAHTQCYITSCFKLITQCKQHQYDSRHQSVLLLMGGHIPFSNVPVQLYSKSMTIIL